ncbi:uncharacterized protein EDB91DRAFT_1240360 [Suillus paluster]|uniref:uncharacterized protein n=1 Tax=Suillus paluster TaxID=48578 RepID=UPI001B87D313|nr:uncharacterized protein EDB91DRAFT_1240360 [Suillus paluster]KAG1720920.1 hypothetical protein EDB91DRAFT_1240360 [Suillus paluster]
MWPDSLGLCHCCLGFFHVGLQFCKPVKPRHSQRFFGFLSSFETLLISCLCFGHPVFLLGIQHNLTRDDKLLGQPNGDDDEALQASPPPNVHMEFFGPGNLLYRNYHTLLDGRPCDKHGHFLPKEFETAKFFYIKNQMPAGQIDHLLDLWATTLLKSGGSPPFADHKDLYATIDSIALGDMKWEGFSCTYTGEKPDSYPPWMDGTYDVWYRDPQEVVLNMLANPAYANEMDYRPYCEYATNGDEQQLRDFMSADWAWNQADIIAGDPETIGSTFVPIILGSDKTTVSVATGNNEYYPLYLSIGNVHNNVCPTNKHTDDPKFRKFHRQLFHSSLSRILASLQPGMSKPEIMKFGDGHFWRVIYRLGPYISDYEEQVLLACIVRFVTKYLCSSHHDNLDAPSVLRCHEYHEALFEAGTYGELWTEFGIVTDLIPFTNNFPHTDIHETMAPDILHQVIKGAFKDYLVDWVEKYLVLTHRRTEADRILDDIDHRIVTIASFSGLRHFPQGCGFKQWTGDDCKALMKVYIPVIEGHVLTDVVHTFRALLEFCYLVRQNTITERTLDEIQDAVSRFHQYREVFKTSGVIPTFSLPQQHSLMHYTHVIRLFGTPNGLCSSITESKHIKAVKDPWRQSSRYKVLGQMLVTNQRLSELAAACVDFESHGMLKGTCLSAELKALSMSDNPNVPNDEDPNDPPPNQASNLEDSNDLTIDHGPTILQAHTRLARTFNAASCAETKRARNVLALADELHLPSLPALICHFLYEQTRPDNTLNMYDIPLAACPRYEGKISVFNSVCSRFYVPSDLSRIGGMQVEHIHSCPMWRNEFSRHDCVFAFFSFNYAGTVYPCAVVHWFDVIGGSPDPETGMWVVQPSLQCQPCAYTHYHTCRTPSTMLLTSSLSTGNQFVHLDITLHVSYDAFRAYHVNKYVDHHTFEIAS